MLPLHAVRYRLTYLQRPVTYLQIAACWVPVVLLSLFHFLQASAARSLIGDPDPYRTEIALLTPGVWLERQNLHGAEANDGHPGRHRQIVAVRRSGTKPKSLRDVDHSAQPYGDGSECEAPAATLRNDGLAVGGRQRFFN